MINPFSILRLSIRESRKRPPHSDNCFSANLAGSYNLIVDKYTIKRSISQFSKIVIIFKRPKAVIQDVFLYHSSITSKTGRFCHTIENQHITFYYF